MPAMNAKILKQQLKEAERELDAATRLSEVKETAAWYMRVKTELKRIEQQAASA